LMQISNVLLGFGMGLLGTAVMLLPEIFAWHKWGIRGVLEWHECQKMVDRLHRCKSLKAALVLHFVNGGLIGIPFLFLVSFVTFLPKPILGFAYGVVVWLLTLAPVHRLITGIPLLRHPQGWQPIVVSLLGHVAFGLTLSLFAYVM